MHIIPDGARHTDTLCSPSAMNKENQHSQKCTVEITNIADITNLGKTGNQKILSGFPGK